MIGESTEWLFIGNLLFWPAISIGFVAAALSAIAAGLFSLPGYLLPMRSYMFGLMMAYAFAAGRGVLKGLSVNQHMGLNQHAFEGWESALRTAGATFCCAAALLAWMFDSRVQCDRIVPIDNYGWDWNRGLIPGVIALALFTPIFFFVNPPSALGLAPAIAFVVLVWACSNGALLSPVKIRPNHGIWQSFQTAIRYICFSVPLAVIVGFGYYLGSLLLTTAPQNALYSGLVNGSLGLCFSSVAVIFGLIPSIQHFVLRLFLWREGRLPWNLPGFLDLAAKVLILRQIGTGYMFVHESLRRCCRDYDP